MVLPSGLSDASHSPKASTLSKSCQPSGLASFNAGVLAMVLGLVVVPIVSLFTAPKDKARVDEMFTCYDRTVTVRAISSLEDSE